MPENNDVFDITNEEIEYYESLTNPFCIDRDCLMINKRCCYEGTITKILSSLKTMKSGQIYNKCSIIFQICTEGYDNYAVASYEFNINIELQKNKKLKKLLYATLGGIPEGKIDLNMLIGKKARFKVKIFDEYVGGTLFQNCTVLEFVK